MLELAVLLVITVVIQLLVPEAPEVSLQSWVQILLMLLLPAEAAEVVVG
jgi:hypothetical protein